MSEEKVTHPFDRLVCCQKHIYNPDELAQQKGDNSSNVDAKFEAKVEIHPEVTKREAEMIENRNHFHRNPETAFKEIDTAAHVAKLLRSYNGGVIKVIEKVGRTGVVGLINGTGPNHPAFDKYCVMLRADMDALPVQELETERNKAYRSQRDGAMHACGHDGHMAMLLCVADTISHPDYRKTIPSNLTIKLCFQPAEEEQSGAKVMVAEGILEETETLGPRVDEVYGIHLWTFAHYGTVQTNNGPLLAASDRFYITVRGSGGHGGVPQVSKDAIICASYLVTQLQTIVSRNVSPLDSAVVTVGTFNAGTAPNVITDRADLSGTVRTLNSDVQATIKRRMNELCENVGKAYGCEVLLHYFYGYPATINGPTSCVELVADCAKAVVGDDAVTTNSDPTMGAEDFSFFLNARPGCFYFVGANPDGQLEQYPHHKSTFDINPSSLAVGASIHLKLIEALPNRVAASKTKK